MSSPAPVTERLVRAPHFVQRDIAGETLLVPVARQVADLRHLVMLTGIAPALWQWLASPHSEQELVARVLREYDVAEDVAQRDTAAFVAQLRAAGLAAPEPERTP